MYTGREKWLGGSVWALVEAERASPFRQAWKDSYAAKFVERAGKADFFITAAGHPMLRIC